jgi:hypothetical protein
MNILGDGFRWGLGGYENGPFGHKGSNWKTENAWDLMTNSDTDVFSITEGIVTKIKSPKTNDPHLFGTSIEITGKGKYPTIFYCNLTGVKLRIGNKVALGEKIGKVSPSQEGVASYLHVALPFGKHISSLVSSNGEILSGKEKTMTAPPKEKSPKKDTAPSSTDDVVDKLTSTLVKGLTPLALGTALFEDVERIKSLLK